MQQKEGCLRRIGYASDERQRACRQAQRDQEIGGYHIRKDQWVGCAVYALHRDPKYWQVRRILTAADFPDFPSAQQPSFTGNVLCAARLLSCLRYCASCAVTSCISLVSELETFNIAGSGQLHPRQVYGGNARGEGRQPGCLGAFWGWRACMCGGEVCHGGKCCMEPACNQEPHLNWHSWQQ